MTRVSNNYLNDDVGDPSNCSEQISRMIDAAW